MIQFRKTELGDIDYVMNLECDLSNSKFITPWSEEQHTAAINNSDIFHAIIEKSNKKLGFVFIRGLLDPNNSIELKRLVINVKGEGIGRAVIVMVKELAFNTWLANRLWLDVLTDNTRAIELYKSEGFIFEGELRESVKKQAGYKSLYLMTILKNEYNNRY